MPRLAEATRKIIDQARAHGRLAYSATGDSSWKKNPDAVRFIEDLRPRHRRAAVLGYLDGYRAAAAEKSTASIES